MIDLDEGDSELARWKHQTRLLERENRDLRERVQKLVLELALAPHDLFSRRAKAREAAMAEEREACARAVEAAADPRKFGEPWPDIRAAFEAAAAAIRARGAR